MGFFSNLHQMAQSGDLQARIGMMEAMASGNPASIQAAMYHRQQIELRRQALQDAEAQRAQQAADRERQLEGASAAGFDKSALLAMTPEGINAAMVARLAPHQFGADGGSVGTPDSTGHMTYQNAPWRTTVGHDIVQGSGTGDPQTVYRGVSEVPIPAGGGLAGYRSDGASGWIAPPAGVAMSPPIASVSGAAANGGAPSPQPSGPPASAPRVGQAGVASTSFRDPGYAPIESQVEQQLGLPSGILSAIRTRGERSNSNQVSPANARSVYQVIPSTRAGVMRQYGVDAWADPQSAAMAAGLVLRDGYNRTHDWNGAVTQYIGGTNPANYGPITHSYVNRIGNVSGPPPAPQQSPPAPAWRGGGQRLSPEQAAQLPPGTVFTGLDGQPRVRQ